MMCRHTPIPHPYLFTLKISMISRLALPKILVPFSTGNFWHYRVPNKSTSAHLFSTTCTNLRHTTRYHRHTEASRLEKVNHLPQPPKRCICIQKDTTHCFCSYTEQPKHQRTLPECASTIFIKTPKSQCTGPNSCISAPWDESRGHRILLSVPILKQSTIPLKAYSIDLYGKRVQQKLRYSVGPNSAELPIRTFCIFRIIFFLT